MEEQSAAAAAPFPTPPPFYQHFTKQNLSRLRQLRKEASATKSQTTTDGAQDPTQTDIDVLSLPTELRYLIPPQPPQDGRYKSFGAAFDLQAPAETLSSQGIEQLYPPHASVKLNPQPHLLALTRSLLTTFLSLIGILSKNPELFESKVEDLQTMMYNIHELINEYRPHQARESLIMMMEERVEKLKDETRRIEAATKTVDNVSRELAEQGARIGPDDQVGAAADDHSKPSHSEIGLKRQRMAWSALASELEAE